MPKTAGTAFRAVLELVYGADRLHTVYPTPADRPTELTTDEQWLADSLTLCRLGTSGPRAVHGHYRIGWYADRFPQATRITWLRHPVDRLVSFYHMWREMPPWPSSSPLQAAVWRGEVDLLGFARAPAMRDQVTRWFLDSSDGRGLAFIGLQERFDEDLARLAALLGWGPVEAPRVNVNQNAGYVGQSIDLATRAEIARLNPSDLGLYQAVLERRWHAGGYMTSQVGAAAETEY